MKIVFIILMIIFICIVQAKISNQHKRDIKEKEKIIPWPIVKSALMNESKVKTNFVMLLLNHSQIDSNNEHRVQMMTKTFLQTKNDCTELLTQFNILNIKNSELHFVMVEKTNDIIGYVLQRIEELDGKRILHLLLQQPAIIMWANNDGQVRLMDNVDYPNTYLTILWTEKKSRIPLIKYYKRMNEGQNRVASILNIILIVLCLVIFILGHNQKLFRIRLLSTVPVFLFPSGHVHNQLHGYHESDENGFSISQSIIECFVIFFGYQIIAVGWFALIEFFRRKK
ncbi:hypothetical protein BLOT_004764 [Blomia tropicalis]|nr:hypothetical protein BLOT_004764 [Blomia tropicalis]